MDFSILHQDKKIFLFHITLGDKRVKFQIHSVTMEIKSRIMYLGNYAHVIRKYLHFALNYFNAKTCNFNLQYHK